MRPQDIVIGEYYRHRDTPNYAWAKAIQVLKPLSKYAQKIYYGKEDANPYTYTIVKCEWSVDKNDSSGFIKHFRPCDLIAGQ